MDGYSAIPVFVAVVESGGFSRAAKVLGISKAAVSKRITLLEDHLGVKLLYRTTRKLSLTEAGEHYFEHAAKAQAAVRDAEDAVAQLQGEPQGRLRISAPMSFGRLHVAPLIPKFLKRYPKIQIDMVMDDKAIDLVEGGFDLAIRSGDLPDSSLIARKLAPGHSVLCASPDYIEHHGRPNTPLEINDHNCIVFSLSSDVNEWTLTNKEETQTITVSGNYRVNNSEALREALIQGMGIGRLPTFIAGADLQAGRLINLFESYTMPHKMIYAAFPEREYMPAKVRAFLDFTIESLGGDQPYWDVACP